MKKALRIKYKKKVPFWGFLFCIISSFGAFGQTTFKTAYEEASASYQAIQKGNNYYSVSQVYDASTNLVGIGLHKFDLQGNIIKTTELFDSIFIMFPSNFIALDTTLQGDLITVGGISTGSAFDNLLLKFDSNLDTIWTSRFPEQDTFTHFHSLASVPDGGFIIASYKNTGGGHVVASLLKTDSAGKKLWTKNYPLVDSVGFFPYHVYNAPDNGFLITGQRSWHRDYQFDDLVLMRVDSLGKVLWTKIIDEGMEDGIPSAVYLGNDKWVVYAANQVGIVVISQNNVKSYKHFFYKISDLDGHILKRSIATQDAQHVMESTNLCMQGEKLVALGQLRNTGFKFGEWVGGYLSFTLAVDTSLNDLWFNIYSHSNKIGDRPDNWSILYDIRPTTDGGFICSGFYESADPVITRGGFHGWLVKLDSNGCVEQNCTNYVGEEEIENSVLKNIEISPNPFSLNLSIVLETKGLPTSFRIYSVSGKELLVGSLNDGFNKIDVSSFKSGFYLIEIEKEGKKFFQKLVKN
tara:strand:- start:119131 stop:120693 length:1563 start_codon:yes stop_codon:yes gene_type:complete